AHVAFAENRKLADRQPARFGEQLGEVGGPLQVTAVYGAEGDRGEAFRDCSRLRSPLLTQLHVQLPVVAVLVTLVGFAVADEIKMGRGLWREDTRSQMFGGKCLVHDLLRWAGMPRLFNVSDRARCMRARFLHVL